MPTNSQIGREFENKVHEFISRTNYITLRENEIVRKYGRLCFGIDHLIETQNFAFAFQDKWIGTNIPLPQTNHFIQACENIIEKINKPLIGIYLSKCPLTSGSKDAFEKKNNNPNSYCKFISFSNYDVNALFENLIRYLYSYKIFFYEPDGSAIMLG